MKRNSTHRSFGQASSLSLAVALAIPAAIALPTVAYAQETQQDFNIAGGDLGTALQRYSAATGVQLVYSSDLVAGKRSPGVSGRMSPQQALGQLLAGSGLSARVSGNTATLLQAGSAGDVAAAEGERLLGPVRVEGSQGSGGFGRAGQQAGVNGVNGSKDITATEGTGSFTSGALTIGSKAPRAIKDVPQSISVLTSERLEQQNLNGFDDIMGQLPGVSVVTSNSNLENQFFSRGFQILSIQVDGGAPLTTRPLDSGGGAFYPQIDMSQYDHVELLRGASGALNGYGSPSGVVNLVRKKPLDRPQLIVEGQAGSWSNYRLMVDGNAPLAFDGRLRGRAVVTYEDRKYFYKTAKSNRISIYSIAEFDVTPSTVLSAGFSHSRQDSLPWSNGLPRYSNGDDLNLPRSTSFAMPWSRWDFRTTEFFGRVEQEISSEWSAKLNITRLRQTTESKQGNGNISVNPVTLTGHRLTGFMSDSGSKQFSMEATVNGAVEIFGQRQEITIGASRARNDFSSSSFQSMISGTAAQPYVPYPGGPGYYFGSPNGISPPIDVFGGFDPYAAIYNEPADPLRSYITDSSANTQTGAYVNLFLTAFDRLHLTTGFRWSRWKSVTEAYSVCTSIPSSGTPQEYNCVGRKIGDRYSPFFVKSKGEDVTWPPSVSLSFDITKNLTAYVGYTDVYIDQSTYLGADLQPIDPVTGENVEGGLKWSSAGGRFNASLSAFRIRQKGFSRDDTEGRYVFDNLPPDGSVSYFIRADNGDLLPNGWADGAGLITCCYVSDPDRTLESKGIELEAAGELAEGWQISGSYTYNDTEQKGGYFGSSSGQAFITITPKHNYKIWTSYDFGRAGNAGWLSNLTISGGLNGRSSSFQSGQVCVEFNPPNSQNVSTCKGNVFRDYSFTVKPYVVFSGRIDYALSKIASVSLNLENILDKKYYSGASSIDSGNWYGTPRSATVTLRAKW